VGGRPIIIDPGGDPPGGGGGVTALGAGFRIGDVEIIPGTDMACDIYPEQRRVVIRSTAAAGSNPLTTKGDIMAHTGAASSRVPVGSNGDVLTADSADADGVSWQAPAAGGFAPGMTMPWSSGTVPSGWLLCDGAAVSRTTYAALFAVIGTDFGVGDGSTTFNLPDCRGRAIVGQDAGQAEFDTIGETGGAKTHTLVAGEMPAHTHVQDAHNHTQDAHTHTQNAHTHTQNAHSHVENAPTSASGGAEDFGIDTNASGSADAGLSTATTVATNQDATAVNQNATATNQAATATNQNAGGGGAHNNLQPYLVLAGWIVKT